MKEGDKVKYMKCWGDRLELGQDSTRLPMIISTSGEREGLKKLYSIHILWIRGSSVVDKHGRVGDT